MSENGPPQPSETNGQGLDASLRQECEELKRTVVQLKTDKAQLMRYLGKLAWEEIDIDKEALLRDFGKEPAIESLIAEIENFGK